LKKRSGLEEGVVLAVPGKRFLSCVQSFQLPKQAELHPLVDVVSPTHPASFKTILEREREASCARWARKKSFEL